MFGRSLPTSSLAILALLLGCGPAAEPQAPQSPTPQPTPGVLRAVEVASGLEHPWGLAFLPDGRMLVTERPGRLPIVEPWDPVIAPSGMAFYAGDAYPGWRGHVFIGSLTPGGLVRLELKDGRVVDEARYLPDAGRVREVTQGPDGFLYLLTDQRNGRILRVEPAGK